MTPLRQLMTYDMQLPNLGSSGIPVCESTPPTVL